MFGSRAAGGGAGCGKYLVKPFSCLLPSIIWDRANERLFVSVVSLALWGCLPYLTLPCSVAQWCVRALVEFIYLHFRSIEKFGFTFY